MNKPLFFFLIILTLLGCASHNTEQTLSQVQYWEINSQYLERKVKLWTYLPPDYSKTKKPLPVLYMHDGQNLFEDSLAYAGEWKVDESLDSLFMRTGKQLVVIGIENGGEERINELTPNSHPKYGGGNAKAYLNFLKLELLPKAESLYSISNKPINRGIMGSSLGGLISFYEAFQVDTPFRKFGVYSPSFWLDANSFEWAQKELIPIGSKMVLMIGEKEQNEHLNVIKMDSLLRIHQKLELKTDIYPNGEHREWFWAAHFQKDVEWLFFE